MSLAGEDRPPHAANASPEARRQAWDGFCRLHSDKIDLAAVDDYLPPISLSGQLRAIARQAALALLDGNAPMLKRFVGPSIFVATGQHNSAEWIDFRLRAVSTMPRYFRALRVVPFAAYLPRARSPREVEFLRQVDGKHAWAVIYSPNPKSWGAIFMQRREQGLQLLGISIDRAGVPD